MPKAVLLEQNDKKTAASVRRLDDGDFPNEDVKVDVEWSCLNYKDALAITGRSPVVRRFPMIPGIDLAGTVVASRDPRFAAGMQILVNGWGVGESHWGGLSQRAGLKGDWLLPLPDGMSARTAMCLGTAGYTAMLCVQALESSGVTPEAGDVLVTGAAGGVGSVAVALLAQRGFRVVASTGRLEEEDYLRKLGAADILDRAALSDVGKPLQKERWAGAVDTVGSHTLANVCASMRYGATVAACGLAQGMDFHATVAPFILRGVRLHGIDSVYAPPSRREAAWAALAAAHPDEFLEDIARLAGLADAIPLAHDLLAGRIRGRLVIDVNR